MSSYTFDSGFARGIAEWNRGRTFESISHDADASAYGNGITAAVELLSGWHDGAERLARLAGGHTRESARALVERMHKSAWPHNGRSITGNPGRRRRARRRRNGGGGGGVGLLLGLGVLGGLFYLTAKASPSSAPALAGLG